MTYNLTPAVNGAKLLCMTDKDKAEFGVWEVDPRHYDRGTIDNLLDLDEGRTECTVRFIYDPDANTITMHYQYPKEETSDRT